ncbi:TMEM175 family protein [Flavihumibacter rivuli]|uniref:TMEM175 family protein n=1 Tax=Flavihumibacter rivuli TaxID=2838156 RepID=UPI001BDF1ABE|nr:TMEM175 family protein [Flavihumibacter rivuli]ULQ56213.1 TMEM175 family protein [Flavihumibacter rivuli]
MEFEVNLDVKRIQGLTDAVFAVAMTILIIEIRIPEGLNADVLSRYFFEKILPELFVYMLGFVTLGIFWIGSHFHHHLITKTDRVSSWLNILFLMSICMIPFSVGFLNHYRHEKLSVIVFSLNLILTSALIYLMLYYSWKKAYIKPHYTLEHFKYARRRIIRPIYCYLAIILISFLSTPIAFYSLLIPIILHLIPENDKMDIEDHIFNY